MLAVCLLLLACGGAAACNECFAVFERLTRNCPSTPIGLASETVPNEPECVLRCTLSRECRMSVYLTESAACSSLLQSDLTSFSGSCGSGIIVRRKLVPPSTAVQILSFSSRVVLFYNFKKGYENLANPSLYPAEPVNVAQRTASDGVLLRNSSGSYVKVATPGFYRYFFYGLGYSVFFQGRFSSNLAGKCISTFSDLITRDYESSLYVRSDGALGAETYFPNGTFYSASWSSHPALALGTAMRLVSLGVNFEGTQFAPQAFFNGTALNTLRRGQSSGSTSRAQLNIHDNLLLGNCANSLVGPFDGWLQCWGLLTGNLLLSQFDELRSLCNA